MITVTCSSCARTLHVEDALSGKEMQCHECQGTLSIHPAKGEPATVAPAVSADSFATVPPAPMGDVVRDERAPPGYEILGEVGRGGMGVVYKARSLALQRVCALKVILSGAHSSCDEVERFKREAQAIARVQHPGIVQVFEVGEHEGRPFMALEYCAGGGLDAKLAKNPLKPKEAATLVQALAEAVQAAHDANVIHRDLKPANVLLSSPLAGSPLHSPEANPQAGKTAEANPQVGAVPKITDFGLAKKLDEDGATRTGSVMGTPSYMPPEQARGEKDIGPAADVYALGAILYECLASRPPFRAPTAFDTIMQVLTEEPVGVRQLNPQAPTDLETIAHKCLSKDPKKRYTSAQELANDLGRYLKGEPIKARPVGNVERAVKWVKRNGVVSALVACVLVALSAGVVVSGYFASSARNEAVAARKETERAEAEKARAEEHLHKAEWLVYAGKLSLAQNTIEEKKGSLALQHLKECQWNLRGWEHRHLWTRLQSKQTLLGHTSEVMCVAWSPDGKFILTGSQDTTARVWDALKGTEILAIKGAWGPVAWSPDGKRILTGSSAGMAKVWDAQNGTELLALRGNGNGVISVAFSADSERILTGGGDGMAKVWDAKKGTELLALMGHTSTVSSVAFSPDGRRILTGSEDKTAKVWDIQKGTELLTLNGHTLPVTSVAFSPDGRHILTGGGNTGPMISPGEAKVWDAVMGTELLPLGYTREVTSVAYSPDGTRILTGSEDGAVRVCDAKKGTELLALKGHADVVHSVAYSPDGTRILTGSRDKTAKVWDSEKGTEVFSLKGHTRMVMSVAYSPNAGRILTGSGDGTAKIWDAEKGTEILTLKGHTREVASVAFSPDGKRILTGSHDKTARVWTSEKGHEVLSLKGHTHEVSSVAWSPDGKGILTGSYDKTARVWDAEKGTKLLSLIGHTGEVTSVSYSLDGKHILTGGCDNTARVWDTLNGQEILSLTGHTAPVASVAYSPDGRRILTGSSDHTARVWDAQHGTEILALKGHTLYVMGVAWSPDGARILTSSVDNTARVWDAQKGLELLSLKGHTQAVTSVAFSPNGTSALTGSADNTARVWDAQKGLEARTLKGHTNNVRSVAFSPNGKLLFAWDDKGMVLAWDTEKGTSVDPTNPPAKPAPGPATSPNGFLVARANRDLVEVTDTRIVVDPKVNHWPLPGAAERKVYHTQQAALAMNEKQYFAAAFHLDRLLRDDPDNAELKKRRDDALKQHNR